MRTPRLRPRERVVCVLSDQTRLHSKSFWKQLPILWVWVTGLEAGALELAQERPGMEVIWLTQSRTLSLLPATGPELSLQMHALATRTTRWHQRPAGGGFWARTLWARLRARLWSFIAAKASFLLTSGGQIQLREPVGSFVSQGAAFSTSSFL